MNNQFATQFLREELGAYNSLKDALYDLGANPQAVALLIAVIEAGYLTPEKALEITQQTIGLSEDGAAAGPAGGGGGGATVGGGTTNGASWTGGTSNGEQYAAGTRRKKLEESEGDYKFKIGDKVKHNNQDWEVLVADRGQYRLKSLKGDPSVWVIKNKVERETPDISEDAPRLAGSPAKTNKRGSKNLSGYSSVGFTKAPTAQEAGKKIKGVEVKELWEELLSEANRYSQFKRQAATRSKPEQMHQAAKIIHSRLEEITKLLEFAYQMRSELSEGEDNLEYKHNTKKVFEKINSKVVEVYSKVKSIS